MASLWTRFRSTSGALMKGMRRNPVGQVAINLAVFATWIPVIVWFKQHVAELTSVEGASMYPYMNEDKDSTLRRDMYLTYKWEPQENLQRGMVVTLRSPYNPEVVVVKRIVGLEGDTVQTREPYPFPTAKVPVGHVWIEGDGRPGTTLDSNTYGPVSMRLLTGKVTHAIYPFHKLGRVRWWEHVRAPIAPRKQ